MSLGGLSSIVLTATAPELVRALVLVDVTPGVNAGKASRITVFVDGPASFENFDELLARTIEHNPERTESSRAAASFTTPFSATTAPGCGDTDAAHRPSSDTRSVPDYGVLWEAISSIHGAVAPRARTGVVGGR